MSNPLQQHWRRLWQSEPAHASPGERLLAITGSAVGILAILWITRQVLDQQGATMIAASMGATAMLLFAMPHSPLSQPWAVLGGHLLGALVGIVAAHYLGDPLVAAPVAVMVTIGLMFWLRCQHPPAVATAMIAIMGGESVRELGYAFLLTPVLENVLILLAVAVLFNLPFAWRRYPASLACQADLGGEDSDELLSHEDLAHALEQVDSYIDVSEQDLQQIFRLAQQHQRLRGTTGPSLATPRSQQAPAPLPESRRATQTAPATQIRDRGR